MSRQEFFIRVNERRNCAEYAVGGKPSVCWTVGQAIDLSETAQWKIGHSLTHSLVRSAALISSLVRSAMLRSLPRLLRSLTRGKVSPNENASLDKFEICVFLTYYKSGMDGLADRRTDTASYRDAKTHLTSTQGYIDASSSIFTNFFPTHF